MDLSKCKRGTGRTHNMLSAAIRYADEFGQSVVVMSSDDEIQNAVRNYCKTPEFEEWRAQYDVKLNTAYGNVKLRMMNIQTAERFTVNFVSAKNVNIEWYQFRIIGTEQKETFFDHHAIELKFAEVLDRWSRYDHPANKASCKAAQEHFDRERQKIDAP